MTYKMDDVVCFCVKFGIPVNPEPAMVDPALLMQRVGLAKEEMIEYASAAEQLAIRPSVEDAKDFLDASVDIVYAIMATCASLGFDFDEAWRRVHSANMAKERAKDANNKRGSAYDVVKPKGWTPPDLTDLVFQPTVRDLLCDKSGSNSARILRTAQEITSTVELERSFRELNGLSRHSATISSLETLDTPSTSSDSLSETTWNEPLGRSHRNSGGNDSANESTAQLDSTATDTSLKDVRKAS